MSCAGRLMSEHNTSRTFAVDALICALARMTASEGRHDAECIRGPDRCPSVSTSRFARAYYTSASGASESNEDPRRIAQEPARTSVRTNNERDQAR